MIRRPPRSTPLYSSAASDVYKRQIFLRHQAGEFDAVVAMYHDQALVPLKLIGFGKSVNITLGLPLIRTSVDHGTAFDRAASFNSDSSSMEAAINSALRLCKNSICCFFWWLYSGKGSPSQYPGFDSEPEKIPLRRSCGCTGFQGDCTKNHVDSESLP